MGRIRDAFAALAGERAAEIVGKILSVILVIAVTVIVTGIVAIGYFHGVRVLHGAGIGRSTELLLLVVFGLVALAAAIAVVPPLVRSVFGEAAGWWTNVFRLIALVVLVFLVFVAWALDFRGAARSTVAGGNGEPVGLVSPPSLALPADIAAIRREAILERYWRILAGADDEWLTRRYETVKQWRPITERYAVATELDRRKVEAIMAVESGGDPRATSRSNARGLMQAIDENAQTYGPACGWAAPSDSYDPERSICMGVSFLVDLSTRHFPGDWETAVAAYNWGVGSMNNALERLAAKFPGSPRSFWALWDKADPESVASLPLAKRTKNPNGYLLFNYGKNPNETRYYVPTVIAWEYIIRHFDEHGRPPDRNDHREPPLVAQLDHPPAPRLPPAQPPSLMPRPSESRSNVWYVARAGDSFGSVVVNMLREDPSIVALLNPDVVAAGLAVAPGAILRLPEERYVFHRASGRESYRDIAARYGMTTAELFRWSGRWNDAQARSVRWRDCPSQGCVDEIALASVGTEFLVRRR